MWSLFFILEGKVNARMNIRKIVDALFLEV